MDKRGLQMAPDEPDRYVNQLIKICRHGRDERLLDRLLVASVTVEGPVLVSTLADRLSDLK